jgi:transcriptional regulator with XRE-family HTH domain
MPRPQRKDEQGKCAGARPLDVGRIVRRLRDEKGLSGAELCRRGRGIEPKTLVALEKGRIRNPSIATLEALARGFGMTVSDLFRRGELADENYFYLGTQKGAFRMDFPAQGVQLISFTPLVEGFFCGKIILESGKSFDETLFLQQGVFFLMVLVGQVEGTVEGRKVLLKEGNNLFFSGEMKFRFSHPSQRNTTLSLVTTPSCLKPRFVSAASRMSND